MIDVDWSEVLGRLLAILIIVVFFAIIYTKARGQTMTESWDEIKNWVGKRK